MGAWIARVRVPVRVRLAALLFVLVVVAGAAVLALALVSTVAVTTQVRGPGGPPGFAAVRQAIQGVSGGAGLLLGPTQGVSPGRAAGGVDFARALAGSYRRGAALPLPKRFPVLAAPAPVARAFVSPTVAGASLPAGARLLALPAGTGLVPLPPGKLNELLTGPLSARALPRSVTALARFRTVVVSATLKAMSLESALALGVLAVLAAIVAWVVAGRALRPLQAITTTARSLSHTTLHERIRMGGPRDEIRDLADTFDDMLHRLETAFRSQRNFLANASHELRTPLSVQRTVIDVVLADPGASADELREALLAVSESVDEERQLIEGLLVLATSERGLAHRERIDLAQVVAHALDAVGRECREAGVSLRTALAPARVEGDPALLARLVGNVLENAARYNRPGGWIEVTMATAGATVRTTVSNSGPVVPPDSVGSLFEPFRRLGDQRTGQGVGLGLSIARAIAIAHGGEVRAQARPDGGLDVTLELPLAAGA